MMLPFQPEFRPELPVVFGAKDYREFRATLEEMERILTATGIEARFIATRIEALGGDLTAKRQQWHWRTFRMALRYSILLGITSDSHRELSRRVADSQIFQWFTHTTFVDGVRPVSKSTIERFEKMFSDDDIAEIIHDTNRAMSDETLAKELLYRETVLRFDEILADTTCVKANIHFPVDWVLLRDGTRTLIKAIMLIRSKGIKHRMGAPETFLRDMNKLCIEMTHVRKKPNAKKMRKGIFRRMKRLMKVVEKHAMTYHRELEALNIVNAICPRSVPLLVKKLKDKEFCRLQKRRGGTEARIGILKNTYLGKPMRSKGFKNRRVRIEWCILAHNLWKLARMAAHRREEIEAELAQAA